MANDPRSESRRPRPPARGARPNGGGARRKAKAANPGRVAAIRALVEVDEGAHAEDALDALAPPDGRDRGLAWHLTLGVLRRRGSLDSVLSPLVKGGLERLDSPVRAALRVGLFELQHSRTETHAAVHQAVEACRGAGGHRGAGLVNAVMRKCTGAVAPTDPALDLPPWLRERWTDRAEWVAKMATPAPICGVWRKIDEPVLDLATVDLQIDGNALPGSFALTAPDGRVPSMPGFQEGAWWVMDPAAARVTQTAMAHAPNRTPTVLDACAAPGGKSFWMASRGGLVTAVDYSSRRLRRVADGAERLGLKVRTVRHDWLEGPSTTLGKYDLVLVDAPCTGLGTLRRHPEIKWRRLPSDPAAMALRQLPILESASRHVAANGTLVYAVCSPMPEEGPAVVAQLSGWRVVDSWGQSAPTGDEDAFQTFVLKRN